MKSCFFKKRENREMITAVKNLTDSEHPYDCTDFTKQCSEEFTICVPIGSTERPERFFAFSGTSEETDYLDCGYTGEKEMKSEKEYEVDMLKRYIRWTLIAQIIFWGFLGAVFITHPEYAQFDMMMNDEYVNALNTQSYRHFQIEDAHAKEQPGYVLSSLLNTMDVSGLLSKLSSPPQEVTESDKEKFITHTSEIVEGLVKHAVKTSIATPARMIGVLFLQFAVVSLYSRMTTLDLKKFNITPHMIWAGAAIFCCIVASSSSSTNFIFAMGVFNTIMLVMWLMIDKRLLSVRLE